MNMPKNISWNVCSADKWKAAILNTAWKCEKKHLSLILEDNLKWNVGCGFCIVLFLFFVCGFFVFVFFFCSVLFRSVPFRSVLFRSVPFCSVLFEGTFMSDFSVCWILVEKICGKKSLQKLRNILEDNIKINFMGHNIVLQQASVVGFKNSLFAHCWGDSKCYPSPCSYSFDMCPSCLNILSFTHQQEFITCCRRQIWLKCFILQTIEKLPDKVLLNIFSYLSHREICRVARVCKKWRVIAYDTRLWKDVSLRPEISGLHVGSLEFLLGLIRLVACNVI